jgi:hypothetical protein
MPTTRVLVVTASRRLGDDTTAVTGGMALTGEPV